MSTYQGLCGGACNGGASAPVLPKPESQLSSHMRTNLLGDALVYQHYQHQITTGKKQFASATDYMRFKKAQILSGTPLCVAGRPPQSAIITRLIETGCQACQPVCPVGTTFENTPQFAPLDLINRDDPPFGFNYTEEQLSILYGRPITLPEPPIGYLYDIGLQLIYPPYCNSTNVLVKVLDNVGNIIPSQITYFGPSPLGEIGGYVVIYPSDIDAIFNGGSITVTASNICSSSSGDAAPIFCFLAGALVTLENGSTKPIETVAIGDRVRGAFGEINTVETLQINPLGFATISNINGEHKTTSHHPHISPDYKFCCVQPDALSTITYGRDHWVTVAGGKKEKHRMAGVNKERIVKLEVGMTLQTLTGPREVTSIEHVPMPRNTPVYHLAVSGSHTYVVDGYAVSGWPNESDFNYDTWTARV